MTTEELKEGKRVFDEIQKVERFQSFLRDKYPVEITVKMIDKQGGGYHHMDPIVIVLDEYQQWGSEGYEIVETYVGLRQMLATAASECHRKLTHLLADIGTAGGRPWAKDTKEENHT